MNHSNIESKLLKVIADSEREIERNTRGHRSSLPKCLQDIRDATAKINQGLTTCMTDDATSSKIGYLHCVNNAYAAVNQAYKDVILSDSCSNDGVVTRRKAMVYLGALWQLGSIKKCLNKKGHIAASNCNSPSILI